MLNWAPGISIEIDPNDILDYYFDFSEFLAADPDIVGATNDTILSAQYMANTATVTEIEQTTTTVHYRVSGVDVKQKVTVRLTLNSGNQVDFSLTFVPKEH